jgi:hypothetical protein
MEILLHLYNIDAIVKPNLKSSSQLSIKDMSSVLLYYIILYFPHR